MEDGESEAGHRAVGGDSAVGNDSAVGGDCAVEGDGAAVDVARAEVVPTVDDLLSAVDLVRRGAEQVAAISAVPADAAGRAGTVGLVAGAGPISEVDDAAVLAVVDELERAMRRIDSARMRCCAEVARRRCAVGRSVGSAATEIAALIGVPVGQARGAIEAGRRAGAAPMLALADGAITARQERIIGEALDELPEAVTAVERAEIAHRLTALAAEGTGPARLGAAAARELNRADPGRAGRVEQEQQRRRSLRLPAADASGISVAGLTVEPCMRALLDAVVARWGRPASTEPGATDERSPEQRGYDALCHALAVALETSNPAPKGVASIVVRITPEELESPFSLVTADTGSVLSTGQAVSMAGTRPWFVSLLREGREELHRIPVDAGAGRIGTRIQRLVLYAAHGGCTHPGCEVPAARCEFHHVVEHRHGGPTSVENGSLACPVHHGWVGELPHQWRTRAEAGSPGRPRWLPPGAKRAAA